MGAHKFLLTLLLASVATPALSQSSGTLTDRSIDWPTVAEWQRVLTLRDYNTRMVVLGAGALGFGAGVVGSFTLLRKRALVGDALSHATFPGVAGVFIFATLLGGSGRSLPLLLAGAAFSGILGVATISLIRRTTRIKEDAALGIVLSVFFGAGVALHRLAFDLGGQAAGLDDFIYGKTAAMVANDVTLILVTSSLCIVASFLLAKEWTLLCFDANYSASQGMPTWLLDALLMTMVVAITIVGLQAVGLVLMIAMLVIPAAAARFWTDRLARMLVIAALLGATSGVIGAAASALLPKLPSGAMIVLVSSLLFALSLVFGATRGLLVRWLRRRRLNHRVELDHLLRGVYEIVEAEHGWPVDDAVSSLDRLLPLRSWSPRQLRTAIRHAQQDGFVRWSGDDSVALTGEGRREAERLVRQHRLWELYLVTYADVATARVDRGADYIEHVLEPSTIARLEALLADSPSPPVPASPHEIALTVDSADANSSERDSSEGE